MVARRRRRAPEADWGTAAPPGTSPAPPRRDKARRTTPPRDVQVISPDLSRVYSTTVRRSLVRIELAGGVALAGLVLDLLRPHPRHRLLHAVEEARVLEAARVEEGAFALLDAAQVVGHRPAGDGPGGADGRSSVSLSGFCSPGVPGAAPCAPGPTLEGCRCCRDRPSRSCCRCPCTASLSVAVAEGPVRHRVDAQRIAALLAGSSATAWRRFCSRPPPALPLSPGFSLNAGAPGCALSSRPSFCSLESAFL